MNVEIETMLSPIKAPCTPSTPDASTPARVDRREALRRLGAMAALSLRP